MVLLLWFLIYQFTSNLPRTPTARINLGISSANERRRYNLTSSLIGSAHTQYDPCGWLFAAVCISLMVLRFQNRNQHCIDLITKRIASWDVVLHVVMSHKETIPHNIRALFCDLMLSKYDHNITSLKHLSRLLYTHYVQPIVRPWGRGIWWLLWVQCMVYILQLPFVIHLPHCLQYHDRDLTRSDYIYFHVLTCCKRYCRYVFGSLCLFSFVLHGAYAYFAYWVQHELHEILQWRHNDDVIMELPWLFHVSHFSGLFIDVGENMDMNMNIGHGYVFKDICGDCTMGKWFRMQTGYVSNCPWKKKRPKVLFFLLSFLQSWFKSIVRI